MSELLILSSQEMHALPADEPVMEQAQVPLSDTGLPLEKEATLLPFDVLLASVLPELTSEMPVGQETPVLEEGQELTLPVLTAEEGALVAEQFMASLLVNPLGGDVPGQEPAGAMPAQSSLLTLAPASRVTVPQTSVGVSEPAPPSTSDKPPVALPETWIRSPEVHAPAVKGSTLAMVHKDEWRGMVPASHHVAQLPVFSTGQLQAQLNRPLYLDTTQADMPQQLQHALGERLNVQVNKQIQHATIRLDPPDMGKIEIVLHFEAGKLQVQISAGQSDVYRALQQVSNELRQALTEQHFVDVEVQISSQTPQQQHSGQQREQHGNMAAPILANDAGETSAAGPREDASILMTI